MTSLEKEAQEWFTKAIRDYWSFKKLSDDLKTAEPALFHAQQALEKWLKGLSILAGEIVPRTHSLIELLGIAKIHYSFLDDQKWLLAFSGLQLYAVDARYPGMFLDPVDLSNDLILADSVLNEMKNIIEAGFPHLTLY